MIEKISEEELKMFVDHAYMGGADTSKSILVNKVFPVWESEKSEYLSQLFGGNLILEKEIEYSNNLDEEMSQRHDLNVLINTLSYGDYSNELKWRDLINVGLTSKSTYFENKCAGGEISFNDGTVFKVMPGEKPFRALTKLFKLRNWNETILEDARIEVSRILQRKKIRGTLCLSIHPLDYATMSDNTYRWSSCMSWDGGEYRMGTIEMMNSPSVLVAYLKGDEPYDISNNTWNSKKWRILCIVDPRIITTVKAYPYPDEGLSREVTEWVKELAIKNLGWEQFKDQPIEYDTLEKTSGTRNWKYSFSTMGSMYVDFHSDLKTAYCLDKNASYRKDERVHINYGGYDQCLECGETDNTRGFNYTDTLCCDMHNDDASDCCCCVCQDWYSEEDVYILESGDAVCNDCFNEYCVKTLLGGLSLFDDCKCITLLPDDGGEPIGYFYVNESDLRRFNHFYFEEVEDKNLMTSDTLTKALKGYFTWTERVWISLYYEPDTTGEDDETREWKLN